jgi:hypothetical protein
MAGRNAAMRRGVKYAGIAAGAALVVVLGRYLWRMIATWGDLVLEDAERGVTFSLRVDTDSDGATVVVRGTGRSGALLRLFEESNQLTKVHLEPVLREALLVMYCVDGAALRSHVVGYDGRREPAAVTEKATAAFLYVHYGLAGEKGPGGIAAGERFCREPIGVYSFGSNVPRVFPRRFRVPASR